MPNSVKIYPLEWGGVKREGGRTRRVTKLLGKIAKDLKNSQSGKISPHLTTLLGRSSVVTRKINH